MSVELNIYNFCALHTYFCFTNRSFSWKNMVIWSTIFFQSIKRKCLARALWLGDIGLRTFVVKIVKLRIYGIVTFAAVTHRRWNVLVIVIIIIIVRFITVAVRCFQNSIISIIRLKTIILFKKKFRKNNFVLLNFRKKTIKQHLWQSLRQMYVNVFKKNIFTFGFYYSRR